MTKSAVITENLASIPRATEFTCAIVYKRVDLDSGAAGGRIGIGRKPN